MTTTAGVNRGCGDLQFYEIRLQGHLDSRFADRLYGLEGNSLAALFFGGLVCTAVGSAIYHWQPHDAGLLWDRLGMVLPFAGLLGLAATGRVSARAGWVSAAAVLVAGPLAVAWWAHTGNLLPWAVVQLGGMLVVLALACLPRREGARARGGRAPARRSW